MTANERATVPMGLSADVRRGYVEWAATRTPGYFAVSRGGRTYGCSYCADTKCTGNGEDVAMRSCIERAPPGAECLIYAYFGKPVFGGDIPYIPYIQPESVGVRMAPPGFTLAEWMEGLSGNDP